MIAQEIKISKGLGSIWYSEATCFKPYSCCGNDRACLDAVMDLMRDEQIALGDVTRVVAGIPKVVINTQTGFNYLADSVLNAQMSLRYNIAVMMVKIDRLILEQFTAERIVDPILFDLARRIEIVIDAEFDAKYPDIHGGGRITLYLRNGKAYTKGVDYSRRHA
jgi:2-methylcitrate dehydratase PrpD